MGIFDMFKKHKNNKKNELLTEKFENNISEEEKKELIKTLPKFEYHPNIYTNDIIKFKHGVCNCCGQEVKAYIESMYCAENVDCICLKCISTGTAVKKFDGTFIQDAQEVKNSEKKEILFNRTPGYFTWQGEYWLACCDDYCEFIGNVGVKELDELGITNEVINEYFERFQFEEPDFLKENLTSNGAVAGYLFRCKQCNKYHLYVDMN